MRQTSRAPGRFRGAGGALASRNDGESGAVNRNDRAQAPEPRGFFACPLRPSLPLQSYNSAIVGITRSARVGRRLVPIPASAVPGVRAVPVVRLDVFGNVACLRPRHRGYIDRAEAPP